jgi:nickel transport protein
MTLRTMPRRALLAILAALPCMFVAPAQAHILKVFAEVSGNMIVGQGYFSSGAYPSNMPVEVFGPGRQKLGQATTDAQGKFSFRPMKRQNHTFVMDAGEGHHAEWTVEADELPAALSAR